ncbi:MAG: SDR family oxidoreductase [Acidobacteria bacterium]|nr:SDR family oxidoreductase [Acidobacteriota bacterium]
MGERLINRVAIVTGGAAGIGEATSLLFAEEGAAVVIGDVDQAQGRRTVEQIRSQGGRAIFVSTDISSEDDSRALCDETLKEFGRIDILINNAAAFVLKGLEATVEDWQKSLGVNVIGGSLMSRYASEAMKRNEGGKGKGAIVNLGSISAFVAQPNFVAYSATKAAMVQMTRNMALDLAPFNIRVNCICPGTILTQASERHCAQLGISLEKFKEEEGAKHLLNRVGYPREVGYAILFLASDEASFITGTHLMVDGGYTAK